MKFEHLICLGSWQMYSLLNVVHNYSNLTTVLINLSRPIPRTNHHLLSLSAFSIKLLQKYIEYLYSLQSVLKFTSILSDQCSHYHLCQMFEMLIGQFRRCLRMNCHLKYYQMYFKKTLERLCYRTSYYYLYFILNHCI